MSTQMAMRCYNLTLDRLLCERVSVARTVWLRTRGLIGRAPLASDQGLLIEPCQGVHTFFMRYAIDVVFLDSSYRVVAIRPSLRPWRLTRIHRQAHASLELPPTTAEREGLLVGHQLEFLD